MRVSDKLEFMNKFKPWADKQRLRDEADATMMRTMAKYNARDFWQKELIDSYIDSKLSIS